jgi:hypothetical protein
LDCSGGQLGQDAGQCCQAVDEVFGEQRELDLVDGLPGGLVGHDRVFVTVGLLGAEEVACAKELYAVASADGSFMSTTFVAWPVWRRATRVVAAFCEGCRTT